MSQAYFYDVYGLSVDEISQAGAGFFRSEGYDAGFYKDYAGRTILQIGKQNGVRYIFGLAYSLTVVMTPQPDGKVLVELGGETWGDKVASGAVGALFLPPLMFTAAYGVWQQSELDDKFWGFLNGFIQQRTGRFPQRVPAVPVYNNQQPNNWQSQNSYTPPPPPPGPPPASYSNYSAYQNQYYGYAAPQQPAPPPAQPAPPPFNYQTPQRSSWFDAKTSQPIFDQQIGRMASWQTAIADGIITDEELNEQQERVNKLEKMLDARLDSEQRLLLAEAVAEIERLEQLQRSALSQAFLKPAS